MPSLASELHHLTQHLSCRHTDIHALITETNNLTQTPLTIEYQTTVLEGPDNSTYHCHILSQSGEEITGFNITLRKTISDRAKATQKIIQNILRPHIHNQYLDENIDIHTICNQIETADPTLYVDFDNISRFPYSTTQKPEELETLKSLRIIIAATSDGRTLTAEPIRIKTLEHQFFQRTSCQQ